jgi:hypothetical protein
VRFAWYGPRGQGLETGRVVTQIVKETLGQSNSLKVKEESFGIKGRQCLPVPGPSTTENVLLVDFAVQTKSSAVVARPCDERLQPDPNPDTETPVSWLAVALAAALPLLEGSLPKDDRGICVLPHPHEMELCTADTDSQGARAGRTVWFTGKVCDSCMDHIDDRHYYHCSKACDVDFCSRCHDELQGVLQDFFRCDSRRDSREHATRAMYWAIHMIDEAALQILNRSASERMSLARLFATEWSTELFQALVDVVVDVCNAKLLYNCNTGALATRVERSDANSGGSDYSVEVTPLYLDECYHFWYNIALLQFLYECSGLQQQEQVFDSHETRGHRIPTGRFILEGINRCSPQVEWTQWETSDRSTPLPDVLRDDTFSCSSVFRLLVAHNNLLPICFRRQCMLSDIHTRWFGNNGGGGPIAAHYLKLEVRREPDALVEDLCREYSPYAAHEEPAAHQHLHKLVIVSFAGEAYGSGQPARGPGVTREFFMVALRALLGAFFVPAEGRSYWFSEVRRPEGYFACGVLLAQVLLHGEHVPKVFPWPLYDLLLRDLGSPRASWRLTLQHLAAVSAEEANSIGKVAEHSGEDITELFGDLGWERVPRLQGRVLTQATKQDFLDAYIEWSLGEKIADRYGPFSEGFRALLGSSTMVRQMVDAKELEHIVCGGEDPVDVGAIRRFAVTQNWHCPGRDEAYLEDFWAVLAALPEADKRQFVVFVTGSDRMPLQGWEELRVRIQKNGEGDDRLASAYTCFSLLLLPKYSCTEVLRVRLLAAIRDSSGFGLH